MILGGFKLFPFLYEYVMFSMYKQNIVIIQKYNALLQINKPDQINLYNYYNIVIPWHPFVIY